MDQTVKWRSRRRCNLHLLLTYCSRAPAASSLIDGSLVKQAARNSQNVRVHLSGSSSVGAGRLGIRNSTRTTGVMSKRGGVSCASSIAVIPKDQISVRWSY